MNCRHDRENQNIVVGEYLISNWESRRMEVLQAFPSSFASPYLLANRVVKTTGTLV